MSKEGPASAEVAQVAELDGGELGVGKLTKGSDYVERTLSSEPTALIAEWPEI